MEEFFIIKDNQFLIATTIINQLKGSHNKAYQRWRKRRGLAAVLKLSGKHYFTAQDTLVFLKGYVHTDAGEMIGETIQTIIKTIEDLISQDSKQAAIVSTDKKVETSVSAVVVDKKVVVSKEKKYTPSFENKNNVLRSKTGPESVSKIIVANGTVSSIVANDVSSSETITSVQSDSKTTVSARKALETKGVSEVQVTGVDVSPLKETKTNRNDPLRAMPSVQPVTALNSRIRPLSETLLVEETKDAVKGGETLRGYSVSDGGVAVLEEPLLNVKTRQRDKTVGRQDNGTARQDSGTRQWDDKTTGQRDKTVGQDSGTTRQQDSETRQWDKTVGRQDNRTARRDSETRRWDGT